MFKVWVRWQVPKGPLAGSQGPLAGSQGPLAGSQILDLGPLAGSQILDLITLERTLDHQKLTLHYVYNGFGGF